MAVIEMAVTGPTLTTLFVHCELWSSSAVRAGCDPFAGKRHKRFFGPCLFPQRAPPRRERRARFQLRALQVRKKTGVASASMTQQQNEGGGARQQARSDEDVISQWHRMAGRARRCSGTRRARVVERSSSRARAAAQACSSVCKAYTHSFRLPQAAAMFRMAVPFVHPARAGILEDRNMTIKVGDKVPSGTLTLATNDGPQKIEAQEYFKGKKVVLFSVPGAFTPTCDAKHLPGFVQRAGDLRAKGIDKIACLAVNDAFVMKAWGKSQGADGKVDMLADGNAEYTRALGLEFDASGFGMGTRGQRFALLIDDGVAKQVNVEEKGEFKVSSAEHVLSQLG
ncbi:MAG TPA: peroxiredoxin [Steroidobacter sp.]|nr:peroxiredoxin [Steroidobacter sp.]